jgi:polysaccharide biosynthesis transport protein
MDQIIPTTLERTSEPVGLYQSDAAGAPNPVLVLWRILRGRLGLAAGVGLALGLPLAALAYLLLPVKYTSTGIVRVAPTLPRVMYKSDENQILPLFDSFVSAQASYLSSRRVLDKAVADPGLCAAGWERPPDGLEELAKDLKVTYRGGTELITASVTCRKPALAQSAVNAVLGAYEAIQRDLGGLTVSEREQTLSRVQREQQVELEVMRGQMADLIAPYGTDDLDQLHSAKINEIVKLEGLIAELDRQLAERDSVGESTGAPAGPPAPDASPESLARTDRMLAHLLDAEVAVKLEIQRLGTKITPDHHQMSALLREREAASSAVEQRMAQLRGEAPAGPVAGAPESTGPTLAQVRSLRERYAQLHETLGAGTMKMGRARLTIAVLKDRMGEKKARLDEVSRELEQIHVESNSPGAGRVSIVQRGDLPYAASSDKRVPVAVLALLAGGGLGVGLVALRGLVGRRYRFIDELEATTMPAVLLGTVPLLGSDDGELEAQAQLSIHHLRHMLQARPGAAGRSRAIAITSPASGDGKTSIAYALGVSFAANGDRTIVVDADLVGCGLTRRLGLSKAAGLREAMGHEELNGEVHPTSIDNLWALPVGADDTLEPAQLSPGMMGPLLDRLRRRFDVVIIDTGPVLGSLEANLLARLADGVLLVVSRGQSSKLVGAAVQQLGRLGAVCAGMVFNRALPQDFERSTSVGSVRSQLSRRDPSRANAPRMAGPRMFPRRADPPVLVGAGSEGDDSGEHRS